MILYFKIIRFLNSICWVSWAKHGQYIVNHRGIHALQQTILLRCLACYSVFCLRSCCYTSMRNDDVFKMLSFILDKTQYKIWGFAWWNVDIVSVCGNTMCSSHLSRSWGTGSEKNLIAQLVSTFSWRRLAHANRNVKKNPRSPHGSPWTIYFSLSDSWETSCPTLVLPWTIISLASRQSRYELCDKILFRTPASR